MDTLNWWEDPQIAPHLEKNCYICGKPWLENRDEDTSHDACWDE
jgi:hypothetical protein